MYIHQASLDSFPRSPLLELSVPNHRAYTQRHGYRYVVHTESALPDRQAHYSNLAEFIAWPRNPLEGQISIRNIPSQFPVKYLADWIL